MLSECKQISHRSKTDYPMLDTYRTVRIKFSKTGNLQYISHLDLQRTFGRVLTRAGIPMWYTKGFNPHAKVIFALPLSVGAQSECEYIDLRIERDMSCDEIRDRLNAVLTDEMQIIEAYVPTSGTEFQSIAWAEYDITIRSQGLCETIATQMQSYLGTSPVMIEKKSKSGLKTVDIVPLIRSLSAKMCEDETVHLNAVLSASGANYLNPEYLIAVLREKFGILAGDPAKEGYTVFRRRVYLADGVTEFH